MPAALDACVSKVMAGWAKNPGSRPKRKKDGTPIEGEKDLRSVAWAICRKSTGLSANLICLEGVGPTILGAGVTNRPHIKGLPPIQVLARGDGTEYLKIPLLRKGHFRHPRGVLVFDNRVYGKMVANFEGNVVGNQISVDLRHKPEFGAVAWFKRVYADNGFLVADADPTAKGLELVKSKAYQYASIEFHPDWANPEIAAFSGDERLEDCIDLQEVEMPKEDTATTDTDDTRDSDGDVLSLEEQLQQERERTQELQERADKLEADAKVQQTAHEASTVQMEARLAALEKTNYQQLAANIVMEAESFRDDKQRAHPKVLLDWIRAIMLEEPIGANEEDEDAEVISLEETDRSSAPKTRAYYRRAVVWLSQNLPGSVPTAEAGTAPDASRTIGLTEEEVDDETMKAEAKALWEA
jgi:hypothetical protein